MNALRGRQSIRAVVMILAVCGSSFDTSAAGRPEERRPWTVDDSISVAYFPSHAFGNDPIFTKPENAAFDIDPSGTYLSFVFKKGNLRTGSTDYQLEVFEVEELRKFASVANAPLPAPIAVATIPNRSNIGGIQRRKWIDGGKAIAFLGSQEEAPEQVYRLDIATGRMVRLTNAPLGVVRFDVRGRDVLYLARVEQRPTMDEIFQNGHAVTDQSIYQLRGAVEEYWGASYSVFFQKHGEQPKRLTEPAQYLRFNDYDFAISPDGTRAIYSSEVTDPGLLAKWNVRSPGQATTVEAGRDLSHFVLLDLTSGRVTPLLKSPSGQAVGSISATTTATALWYPDSQHALLANTTVPADTEKGYSPTAWIVDVDLTKPGYVTVAPARDDHTPVPGTSRHPLVNHLAWRKPGSEVEITYADPDLKTQTVVRYRGANGKWNESGRQQGDLDYADRNGLRISVRESSTLPPELQVSLGDREPKPFTAINANLASVEVLPTQSFTWSVAPDASWTAGLTLPKRVGAPSPVVVQVGRFVPDRFFPDGASSAAYSTQTLAANGIAVLTVRLTDVRAGPSEGDDFVRGLDIGLKKLAAEGVIDLSRVGLLGFSRAGFRVKWAVTHPQQTRYAAALCSDAYDPGYVSYIFDWRGNGGHLRDFTQGFYDGSFWQAKEKWLDRSPWFNADRVTTPLAIDSHGSTLVSDWEPYAALRYLNKPVELVHLPNAGHQISRVRERQTTQNLTTDWFRFWLKGEETDEPGKADQYKRWRAMRVATSDGSP
jgi:dipeptidyl aminopeptidase/acylaminoacyl peptidase